MAPKSMKYDGPTKKEVMNKGAWTPEEDRKLAHCIEVHGAKRWKTISVKSGLNRCGKSCRLRWLNYLRPNIKRGNISNEEEDLIIRLHKLLGNRWSLIAGRIPGRTDNEIKNYWNSHLCKKINHKEEKPETSTAQESVTQDHNTGESAVLEHDDDDVGESSDNVNFDVNEFFDFSTDHENFGFDRMNKYLELDDQIQNTKEEINLHCVDQ